MQNLLYLMQGIAFSLLGILMLREAKRAVSENLKSESLPRPRFGSKMATIGLFISEITLALFLTNFYGADQTNLMRILLMCSILWPCAWADIQNYIIPNKVILMGLICGVVLLAFCVLKEPNQAKWLLFRTAISVGALMLAALLCRLISPKSVGMGDIKLLGVLGLVLGMGLVWNALFFALCCMFIYCVFLLATKRAKRSDSVPFAPFLLFGLLVASVLTGI